MVGENWIENRKYTYRRELKWPVEAIDIHHVVVRRSSASRFFIYLCLVIGLSNAVFLVLSKVPNLRFFLSTPICFNAANFSSWLTFM